MDNLRDLPPRKEQILQILNHSDQIEAIQAAQILAAVYEWCGQTAASAPENWIEQMELLAAYGEVFEQAGRFTSIFNDLLHQTRSGANLERLFTWHSEQIRQIKTRLAELQGDVSALEAQTGELQELSNQLNKLADKKSS